LEKKTHRGERPERKTSPKTRQPTLQAFRRVQKGKLGMDHPALKHQGNRERENQKRDGDGYRGRETEECARLIWIISLTYRYLSRTKKLRLGGGEIPEREDMSAKEEFTAGGKNIRERSL